MSARGRPVHFPVTLACHRMRRRIRIEHARRLAVARQQLSGSRPRPVTADDIHALVRAIGCLQLDPTGIVARSHLLVLFSRLGAFDPKLVDTLLWDERRLYEYWAHQASIVATEDRALHLALPPPWLDQRTTAAWMTTRARFSELVLERLAATASVRAGGVLVPNAGGPNSRPRRRASPGRRPVPTRARRGHAAASEAPFRPAPLSGACARLETARGRRGNRSDRPWAQRRLVHPCGRPRAARPD